MNIQAIMKENLTRMAELSTNSTSRVSSLKGLARKR
jgi:hypothetical protein